MADIGTWIGGTSAAATFVIAVFAVVQSLAAKRAADAAKLTAEILIEGYCPQLIAKPHGNPVKDLLDPLEIPRLQIEVTNRGMTPGLDLRYESWIEVLEQPFSEFTQSVDHYESAESMSLGPGAPLVINIPIRKGLKDDEREAIRHFRLIVCTRVKVTYRDSFRKQRRWVSFGFWVKHDGLAFLPKYNETGIDE